MRSESFSVLFSATAPGINGELVDKLHARGRTYGSVSTVIARNVILSDAHRQVVECAIKCRPVRDMSPGDVLQNYRGDRFQVITIDKTQDLYWTIFAKRGESQVTIDQATPRAVIDG